MYKLYNKCKEKLKRKKENKWASVARGVCKHSIVHIAVLIKITV